MIYKLLWNKNKHFGSVFILMGFIFDKFNIFYRFSSSVKLSINLECFWWKLFYILGRILDFFEIFHLVQSQSKLYFLLYSFPIDSPITTAYVYGNLIWNQKISHIFQFLLPLTDICFKKKSILCRLHKMQSYVLHHFFFFLMSFSIQKTFRQHCMHFKNICGNSGSQHLVPFAWLKMSGNVLSTLTLAFGWL